MKKINLRSFERLVFANSGFNIIVMIKPTRTRKGPSERALRQRDRLDLISRYMENLN